MAESKQQYIMQAQENGSVMISEDVIATLVDNAACEVEGVAGISVKPGADIAEMIGKKNWGKGIKIAIGENNEIVIDCNINIVYGQSVVTVAAAVQQAISAAIDSMVGVKVASVNVNVCGIVRK